MNLSTLTQEVEGLVKPLDGKKKFYIIITCIVIGIVCWNVFSPSNNRSGIDEVRTDLQSIGAEQSTAGQAIGESKFIVNEIRDTNKSVKYEIDSSRAINNSSADLITEGKSILRQVRTRD